MGRAREIMDLLTDAITAGDREALRRLYAPDAVAETPDAGRVEGREAIVDYLVTYKPAFPDMSWEGVSQYEIGDTAIDEGYFLGTHTGVLTSPGGDVPPTGRNVRVRECDLVTVRDGLAVSHRFYYDQFDFMAQLGLRESDAAAGGVPEPRAGTEQRAGEPAR